MDSEELNVVIVSALACYVANEYLKTKKNKKRVVLAAVGLHNFIKLNQLSAHKYCPPSFIDHEDNDGNFVPGGWRNEVEPAQINQKKPNSDQIIHPKMLFSTAQF